MEPNDEPYPPTWRRRFRWGLGQKGRWISGQALKPTVDVNGFGDQSAEPFTDLPFWKFFTLLVQPSTQPYLGNLPKPHSIVLPETFHTRCNQCARKPFVNWKQDQIPQTRFPPIKRPSIKNTKILQEISHTCPRWTKGIKNIVFRHWRCFMRACTAKQSTQNENQNEMAAITHLHPLWVPWHRRARVNLDRSGTPTKMAFSLLTSGLPTFSLHRQNSGTKWRLLTFDDSQSQDKWNRSHHATVSNHIIRGKEESAHRKFRSINSWVEKQSVNQLTNIFETIETPASHTRHQTTRYFLRELHVQVPNCRRLKKTFWELCLETQNINKLLESQPEHKVACVRMTQGGNAGHVCCSSGIGPWRKQFISIWSFGSRLPRQRRASWSNPGIRSTVFRMWQLGFFLTESMRSTSLV